MHSDAEIDRAADAYLAEGLGAIGIPFWRYLGTPTTRPTQGANHIHREEKGGTAAATTRAAVTTRTSAGHRPRSF